MNKVKVLTSVLAALLASAGSAAHAVPAESTPMSAVGIGAGSTNDALFAIENNRLSIVDRIMTNLDGSLKSGAHNAANVRAGLLKLRADQLLSASLSNALPDVMQILAEPVATGPATHRYVAVAPTTAFGFVAPDAATSFVLRHNDDLTLAKPGDLFSAVEGTNVVGYFVANSVATSSDASGFSAIISSRKDGVGTGSGSWIGFVGGGNVASGTNSAVTAGFNNAATALGSYVGAGQNNSANGVSSLVLGGFGNKANGIDSIVGAGAFNTATGARSALVGGFGNSAAGDFSFIGGGGRDTNTAAVAGSAPQDNKAYGKWSVIGGGQGNVTGINGNLVNRNNVVVGGHRNSATGQNAFVGAGGCNVASSDGAVVVGGGQTADAGACSFGNTASGLYSFIGGGFSNTAAGTSSVAMGQSATANDSNSFTWASGSTYAPANGAGSFNIAAPSGVHLNGDTRLDFGSTTRQMVSLWGGANAYGIGVQGGTQYYRVDLGASNTSGYAWFRGGVHSNTAFDPGAGGIRVMSLSRDGQLVLPQVLQQQIRIGDSAAGGDVMGIGAQNYTTYTRVPGLGGFAVYQDGAHVTTEADPGVGGTILAGVYTAGGGSFLSGKTMTGTVRAAAFLVASDSGLKTSFEAVSPKAILAKIAAMPVTSWVYKHDGPSAARHIGPMAQDFAKAFGLGYDDKTISTVDADGIAFAAIKGLSELLQEKDAQIGKLQREMNAIKKKLGL